jgi:hypothetical protein
MVGRRRNKPDGEPSIMLQRQLSIGLVAGLALASGEAGAQTLHARQGATVALGPMSASVYYEDAGGAYRVVATLADGPEGIPVRFIATLQPGQEVTISVPGLAGRSATELHLTRTPDGLDVAYPRRAVD